MAISNLERYKKDLKSLIDEGGQLYNAMQKECFPSEFMAKVKEALLSTEAESFLKGLPNFVDGYQRWYSAAMVLVKQLLPDRLDDFVRHYERPKTRKLVNHETYRILDYLQGLTVTTQLHVM